jgi:uncharacterized membrane protein
MKNILNRLWKYRWHLLIFFSILVHTFITYVINLTRHYSFKSSLLDLGVFVQSIWSFSEYGVPVTSINPPYEVHNWLGFHFSPIVLIISVFDQFFPLDQMLIFLNSFFISIAVVPLFMACKRLGVKENIAYSFTLLYLINPFVIHAAVFDFHELSIAVPFFAVGLLAILEKRFKLLLFSMIVLVLCKEHFGLSVAGFGILWCLYHREWLKGIFLVCLGITAFISIPFYLMPYLNDFGSHPMFTAENDHLQRYSWIGLPWPSMVESLFALIVDKSTLAYVILLLGPFCLTPLLGVIFLIPGGADLAANLLSTNPMPKSVFAYHSGTLIPVFIIAACYAVKNSPRVNSQQIKPTIIASICISVLICYYTFPFGLPKAANIWQINALNLKRPPVIQELKKRFSPGESLSVQANIGAYFAERKQIFPFPKGLDKVDSIILLLEYPFDTIQHTPFEAPYAITEPAQFAGAVKKLLERKDFGIIYFNDGWLIAKRGASSSVSKDAIFERLNAIGFRKYLQIGD